MTYLYMFILNFYAGDKKTPGELYRRSVNMIDYITLLTTYNSNQSARFQFGKGEFAVLKTAPSKT